jgi:RNA polymerase sigma factor (sigma-70 family)
MRPFSRNAVDRVREFLAAHDLDALPDYDLLTRFADTRDEGAFATLVRRHTAIVIGTARRVLGNAADADDVFQAAFVTLARKAVSVRCEGSLAPWLHRVTFRLALRARKGRRSLPAGLGRPVEHTPDPLAQLSGRELCSVIDAEVARLSANLRKPIVLCCLQGLTRDEAAGRLGWSVPTLKRRLARAREVLEHRLGARGIALPAALAPALLAATWPTPAPADVVHATLEIAAGRAAVPVRIGQLCAGSAGAAHAWIGFAAAGWVLAVGLFFGLRPGSSPPGPLPEPPAAPKDERPQAATDVHGDPLPPGAVARIGTTRFRHDEWLYLADWSPDGRFIASSAGKTVIVWEADTGRELHRHTFTEPASGPKTEQGFRLPAFIQALEWSPDGTALLTAFDNKVQHWAWDGTKKTLRLVATHEKGGDQAPLVSSGFALGGAHALFVTASGFGTTELARNVRGIGTEFKGAAINRAEVSPDGRTGAMAITGERPMLHVYDLGNPGSGPTQSFDRSAGNLAFSGDGKTFAAVIEGPDKQLSVEVWDATTWRSQRVIPMPKPTDRDPEVRALALSPDGRTLVTGGVDKVLRWWDTATGKQTRQSPPGILYFNRAAFRPDSKVLMTVSHENHIRLWDVAKGRELPVPSGPDWVIVATAFTPDGKTVLTVSDQSLFAHDAATGRELWRGTGHTDSAVQVCVTPDGSTAISSGHDGRIVFWDMATGRIVRTIENPRHSTDFLTLSPDGRTLVALGGDPPHDGIVRRWDLPSGKAHPTQPLPAKPTRYAAYGIQFAPDGTGFIIASGTETHVPLFDPTGKEARQRFGPGDGGITWAEHSPDGRMVAAATAGGSIYIWETATGGQRLHLKDIGYTTCLAISPDGRFLAAANNGRHRLVSGDKATEHINARTVVRILDTFTGGELHRFAGHLGSVNRLAWSPDGRRLLSGSHDATCLVWDVPGTVKIKAPIVPADAAPADGLVEALSAPNAAEAYGTMAKLVAAPATAVPALGKRLRPVPTADPAKVDELIRDLDSPRFEVRDRAAGQLARLGDGAEGRMRRALAGKLSAEARDRIDRILAALKPSVDRLWQGRALEVLQRIGSDDSCRLLGELAAGADGAWLTREANAAARRILSER